ncbi:MAG: hypothetical protein AB2L13_19035 [Spirochaetota bacterium]
MKSDLSVKSTYPQGAEDVDHLGRGDAHVRFLEYPYELEDLLRSAALFFGGILHTVDRRAWTAPGILMNEHLGGMFFYQLYVLFVF